MVATLCLIGCVLAPAQPPDRPWPVAGAGDRLLGPRLGAAQEFTYRGTYDEEGGVSRVRFSRSYRIDTRIFVLDTPPGGADVALLTVLRPRDSHAGTGPNGVSGESAVSSARLAVARVDLQGRVSPEPGANFLVPLDAPPVIECGAFVEIPSSRVAAEGAWIVPELGRPPRTWHTAGSEMVNGTSCIKLVGEQQSEDWDKPRGDRAAWRRTDTVWVAPRLGVAYRVERVIERRDAAARAPTHRQILRYELDSSVQYPGQLFDDRRQEIARARSFSSSAAPCLADSSHSGPQLSALLSRINYHLEHQPPTPYRDAILQLRKQIEAARRGESAFVPDEANETPAAATVGRPAPDFVATDLTNAEASTVRLRNWLGRPVLLVFYNPASQTTEDLFQFARGVQSRFNGGVTVLGLSVSDDVKVVRKQWAELNPGFPVLSGGGLRVSYEVETTPKLVLIDSAGIVRGSYIGWGHETAGEVLAELRRWQKRP
jgi:peroxiredoxin